MKPQKLAATALFISLLAFTPECHAQGPGWTTAGTLSVPRHYGHRSALLANGKVIIVGGEIASDRSPTTSVELYDPAIGKWSATGNLRTPRSRHFVVRLADGRVLAAGGNGDSKAEIYDPDAGVWSDTGSLTISRHTAEAVLLRDGKVLVTGGSNTRTAEIYDPAKGTWSAAGTMTSLRSPVGSTVLHHTSTLLPDGKVLVVGGPDRNALSSLSANSNRALQTAELYDPATGSWTATGEMITPRFNHTATLLPNGSVLVAGGARAFGVARPCDDLTDAELVEIYDPATGRWTATGSLNRPRAHHTATLLPNGKVLVTGVSDSSSCSVLNSSEIYDPATGIWTVVDQPNTTRAPHQATLLTNGAVLLSGGAGSGAEVFESTSTLASTWEATHAVAAPLAPESIATVYAASFTAVTSSAEGTPLPTDIAGVKLQVRDRTGTDRAAPLYFVSPRQINYQVPPGTAIGLATLTVTQDGVFAAAGLAEIVPVAPAVFSLYSEYEDGRHVAAAVALRVKADGTQQYEPVATWVWNEYRYMVEPIDLGPASDQVFLILYGTGIRFRSSLSAVAATIGGTEIEVLYAGSAAASTGLDQLNLRLPRSLVGRGDVVVAVSVDGKATNPVRVFIR